MSAADPLAPLRPDVLNDLPAVSASRVAGVLGDHPSLYSRSPVMWNAAFAALGVPAVYLPFDVAPARVDAFLAACRAAPALLGFSVTVPYKERVLAQLDGVDTDAEAIGAVNTVLRTPEGKLLGTNTDGAAARAVLRRFVGASSAGDQSRSLLLLGAGGAARAVGVAVARGMAAATILLCNRRPERAAETARIIRQAGVEVTVVRPDELDTVLAGVDSVVNASSVGMAGPVRTDDRVTWLEPFSPLAPADPPRIRPLQAAGALPPVEWWPRAWPGIARNLEVSLRRTLRLRPGAVVLDLIYAPLETVLLKHARWTGHAAVNGLDVLVEQAVDAFMRVSRPLLQDGEPDPRPAIGRAMHAVLR